uniref:uncharacterized protein LOC122580649 n=1 Tax=Erigeron canadensis TaxID=72917 RepID=UPI001CB966AA|nr:uncharacterized protein LOC122580649 [Erigeron canadensis]
MPSPKIGFFDEKPTFRFGMQDNFKDQSPLSNESRQNKLVSPNFSPSVSTENCLRVGKFLSSENVGRVGGNCSKLKADRQIPKEISRNRKNMEQKRQKEDIVFDIKKMHDSDQWENQKENVCSFEDQVNGISRHLEVIDLNRDLIEVKSQQSYVKPSQTSLPPTDEYITPCSRPPLAEKVVGN